MGIVGDYTFVVDKVGSQDIGCRGVVVVGTLGIGTLEVVGKWLVVVDEFVVVELEKHCFEVGCFGVIFSFMVVIVDNWVDLGKEGVNSKVAYL